MGVETPEQVRCSIWKMRNKVGLVWGMMFCAGFLASAVAQELRPSSTGPLRSPAELDQLLMPIALFPDPLIAEILPAATVPSQIVIVDRELSVGIALSQVDQESVDPSIKALARFPTVLQFMDA